MAPAHITQGSTVTYNVHSFRYFPPSTLAAAVIANVLGGKYLSECTLYVTVEPCVMCAGAIAWAQTGKLVFGAEDEKRGYQRYAADALHPKTVVVKGILADECAALMREFFAAKRK